MMQLLEKQRSLEYNLNHEMLQKLHGKKGYKIMKKRKYTFEKADMIEAWNAGKKGVGGCICRLFDEERTVCPSERYCAEILGRIWALYGEPNDPECYEDFYEYTVSAIDMEGDRFYLEIYQYSGMPSIGGPVNGPYEIKAKEAANELAELILSTKPTDYEWRGVYVDYDVNMKYYVKNGKAGKKDKFRNPVQKLYTKKGNLLILNNNDTELD